MKILHCQVKIRKIYKDPKCAYPMDVNMGSLGKSDDVGVTLHLGWSHQNLSPPHPEPRKSNGKEMEPTRKNANIFIMRIIVLDFEESSHLFLPT